MPTIADVCAFLSTIAPPTLAEDWDNVGLLVGDPARPARRIMTCLTVTAASAAEAARERTDLIVTHHPIPFRPLKQLTTHTVTGRLLLQLIEAGIAVHSSHTAFDSAEAGINQWLAEGLRLSAIRPLVEAKESPEVGAGRRGFLDPPATLEEMSRRLKVFLQIPHLHRVGAAERIVRSVVVACGSAGQFLPAARDAGCDLMVTGETSFHTCLEAEATGVALLLPGHFASERFGVERLARKLESQFTDTTVWASRDEKDPLVWE